MDRTKTEEDATKELIENKIRERLGQLGVRVKSTEELVENSKPLIMLYLRHVEGDPAIVEGSTTGVCEICKNKISISPSSQEILAQRAQLKNKVRIICLVCFNNQGKN